MYLLKNSPFENAPSHLASLVTKRAHFLAGSPAAALAFLHPASTLSMARDTPYCPGVAGWRPYTEVM
jgi:hypothetical protein